MNTTSLIQSLQGRKQVTFAILLIWAALACGPALTPTAATGQELVQESQNTPQSPTAFIYQGQLKEGDLAAIGRFDFQFTLYTAQTGGEELGSFLHEDMLLTNGLFKVSLDFGRAATGGHETWLEIAVRPSSSGVSYMVLSPRQRLTPTPYAILAQHDQWSLIGVPVGVASGRAKDVVPTDEVAALATANYIPKYTGPDLVISTLKIPQLADSVMLESGGKIGVGTTTPAEKLDVAGTVKATAFLGDGSALTGISDSTKVAKAGDTMTGTLSLPANGLVAGTDQLVLADGKVGVGTMMPAEKLDVAGNVKAMAFLGDGSALTGISDSTKVAKAGDMMTGTLSLPANGLVAGTNQLVLADGKVGVGTMSPATLFSVGTNSPFQVNPSGDLVKIKNVTYSWPTTAPANTVLTHTSDGTLAWIPVPGGGFTGNCSSGAGFVTKWSSASAVTCSQLFDNGTNVGIGTASPGRLLTLSRATEAASTQIELRNVGGMTNGNFDGISFTQGATGSTALGNIKLHYASDGGTALAFETRGSSSASGDAPVTEKVRVDKDGKVGIGTTMPAEKLDVAGKIKAMAFLGDGSALTGINDAAKVAKAGDTMTGMLNLPANGLAAGSNQLVLAAGHVGIGTTSPNVRLHIAGGTDAQLTGGGFLQVGSSTSTNILVDNNEIMARNNGATATLALNANGGNVTLIQSGTGSVGIGTASPSPLFKLHVEGSSAGILGINTSGLGVGVRGDSSTGTGVSGLSGSGNGVFGSSGSGDGVRGVSNSGVGVSAWSESGNIIEGRDGSPSGGGRSGSSGTLRFLITNAGNVGIGTATPAEKLDVNGRIRVTQLAGPASTHLCTNNNVISSCSGSDARLKTNFRPLVNVLEKLNTVRGVSFEWNEAYQSIGGASAGREIGVIAQEVEAAFPELVTQMENGYKTVNYERLTAVLIEAVKELNAKHDKLEADNEALRAELKSLMQMVKQLKEAIGK
jgi:hypothetical protein